MIREYLHGWAHAIFWAAPVAVVGWYFGWSGVVAWVGFVFSVVIGAVVMRRLRVNRLLRSR